MRVHDLSISVSVLDPLDVLTVMESEFGGKGKEKPAAEEGKKTFAVRKEGSWE